MAHTAGRLTVEELEVRRGARLLVEGLSFGLEAGNRALIVGRNGTGKTSLLRILAGIAPVTAGRISVDGRASTDWGPEDRGKLAYRGHLDGLKLDMSPRENIAFYSALRGISADGSAVFEELGLAGLADRPIRQLSAGQRRRAGLAVLRCIEADVWFLDEPITNLDTDGRRLVADWLDRHTAAGGMAVIATHNPAELTSPGSLLIEL